MKAAPGIARHGLLRLVPPPSRWRPLLARVPALWLAPVVERALSHGLVAMRDDPSMQLIVQRRFGLEIEDLGLRWVLQWRDGRVVQAEGPAEASIRGTLTDLAILAARLEDADTLFFKRHLTLTGDTELGLVLRNLLDRLPWTSIPLGERIVLQRGARFLRAARAAHRPRAD